MSKSYLTIAQAYIKLGLAGGGTSWIRKSELLATGKCDESLLTNYVGYEFVVDDDIVKKEKPVILFETTYFNSVFKTYSYNSELRCGYYKGNCGSISGLTSTNNWALDTFYVDINNANYMLVIHRGFNAENYIKETLKLKVSLLINWGGQPINMVFEFTNSYGSSGFQGWKPKGENNTFFENYKKYYSVCRNVTLEYSGALK